jgi:hypothetical protein
MKFLNKLLRKPPPSPSTEEKLAIVPVPPLVVLLLNLERHKGSALTKEEVFEIRDNAICIAMPIDVRDEIAAKRGYPDLNPEYVWEDWTAIRHSLLDQGE